MSVSFQVVADVRVGVFVVVAARAGRRAASSKRLPQVLSLPGSHQQSRPQSRNDSDERLQQRLIGQHRAAFAHGDVVGGIEADGGQIAEGADLLAVVSRADRVAAVFDQPEIMACRAKAVTAARSKGLPSVWAIMTARVRGESAASSCVTSTL